MKITGLVLISIGLALMLFIAFNFIKERNRMASPIPEENGVKVIFVTPTK
ncbi:hypothetical protein HY357_03560 [Candidatus Roizmanbacteria bacterium]|nr:hypothetical protein [Candidatus Roizmanbacteria bacterium]